MQFNRPKIIRPPSEWKSYYLPITNGCSNNTCTFCAYYGNKLQLRDVLEVKKEIDALASYRSSGVYLPDIPKIVYEIAREWDGKRVFLQDSDALIYPMVKLRDILNYLNAKIPTLKRVGIYATPQSILRKDPEELEELKDLKLGIIYQGVETGDEELLEKVRKGVNYAQMVEAGRRVKKSGIELSVTVILGLGGVEGSNKHALETAKILTEIDPDYSGSLTLTLVPGTPLYKQWEKGEFSPLSPFQSIEELVTIMENASFTNCLFGSVHASNYFSVQGRLPREKEKMLGELKGILTRKDPSLLRPDFLRAL